MAAVPKSGEVYYADDGTVSIVLDDNYDPNYEPPEKEIVEYAKWLGIDPDAEKDLLWIAKDGLKAPLPKEWKPCKTDTGDVYYFNFKSGESIWDHPMDEIYKKKVEDERAKLLKSGKQSTGVKPLVKGGAGNSDTAPKSRTSLEESRPKSGRLGAIGSSEEQKTVRPDISGLLPSKSEQIATTLLGKKKEPLKDMRETERALRKKYDQEFEAIRASLKQNQERQLADQKTQLASELRKITNDLKADVEDEVEQAKRSGERRNKKELQLYEDSLDKQKEDLRRTRQAAQEKLAAETAAINRRVDADLSEKRQATEKQIAQEISRRRQELQDAWTREKTQTEMDTQAKLRELRNAHEARVEQQHQKAVAALSAKVHQLENALLQEIALAKVQIQQERAAHSEALRLQTAATQDSQTAAFHAANAKYQEAVAHAHREADAALEQARRQAAAEAEAVRAEYERKKTDAEREVREQSARSAADALSARREYAERRVREAEADLSSRFQAEKTSFEQDTERLVREAMAQKEVSEAARSQAADAALSSAKHQALEQRRVTLESAERSHKLRMDAIRAELSSSLSAQKNADPTQQPEYHRLLQQRKEQWLTSNPAPIYHLPRLQPVPVFDPSSAAPPTPVVVTKEVEAAPTAAQIASVVAEAQESALRDATRSHDAELAALQASLRASFEKEYEEHRRKATTSMQERLDTYRAGGGSPMRNSKARVAHAKMLREAQSGRPSDVTTFGTDSVPEEEADRQLMELRVSLQRSLDQLVFRLSAEAAEATSAIANAQSELQDLLSAAQAAAETVGPLQLRASTGSAYLTSMLRQDSSQQVAMSRGDSGTAYGVEMQPVRTDSAALIIPRSTTPQQQHLGALGSHTNTPSGKPGRHSSFDTRLSKAHDLLHRKKKEIRARQKRLEDVRADWKRDMAAAKAARDDKQVQTLKRVAEVLEMDARQLNKEAIALKESYEWLKREGEAYAARHGSAPGRGTSPGRRPGSAVRVPEGAGDLGALLADILHRTEAVEHQMARVESHHFSSPNRGLERGGQIGDGGDAADKRRDETYNKWNSWLRQSVDGADTGAAPATYQSPKKAATVASWVREQQQGK